MDHLSTRLDSIGRVDRRHHHGGPAEVQDLAKNDARDLAQLPRIEEKFAVRDQPLAPTERVRAGEVLGGCWRENRREEVIDLAVDRDDRSETKSATLFRR